MKLQRVFLTKGLAAPVLSPAQPATGVALEKIRRVVDLMNNRPPKRWVTWPQGYCLPKEDWLGDLISFCNPQWFPHFPDLSHQADRGCRLLRCLYCPARACSTAR